jgi:hypothetical protein
LEPIAAIYSMCGDRRVLAASLDRMRDMAGRTFTEPSDIAQRQAAGRASGAGARRIALRATGF